jgi:hypothetical protein
MTYESGDELTKSLANGFGAVDPCECGYTMLDRTPEQLQSHVA